jgi:putative nucleotidyltransferase with HDIG domain
MQELDDYINRMEHLPPSPKILPPLMQLLNQPDVDCTKVVQLIALDASLTAAVLKLCNSATSGSALKIDDLNHAITRLGFQTIYQLVASICGSRVLSSKQAGYGLNEGELWHHSVVAAVAAQVIARNLGENESTVFTTALLHDLGKIVLARALESRYSAVIDEVERNHRSMLDAEKHLLGVQHAEVGGRLLARWQFPESLVAPVWHHHHPAAAGKHERIAACVHLGNLISSLMGHGYGHYAFAVEGQADAFKILNLDRDALPRYMIQTQEAYASVEALVRVR